MMVALRGIILLASILACLQVVAGENIHLVGAKTSQSGVAWGGEPWKGVDGNKESHYFGHSCTHTTEQISSWWSVDLPGTWDVETVTVYNRRDCCTDRNNELDVLVIGADGKTKAECGQFRGEAKDVVTIKCDPPANGNKIIITIPGSRGPVPLTLCEVEATGRGTNKAAPISLMGAYAQQTSTAWGGEAIRAVDGNREQNYWGNSCTHTDGKANPMLHIALPGTYEVTAVKLWNRMDCCGDRLNVVDVHVLAGDKMNVCKKFSGKAGDVLEITCEDGAVGQALMISIPETVGPMTLTVCEVEAWGIAQ